jgi:protein-disulfide isomerase
MIARLSRGSFASGAALAVALALAGCGSDNKQADLTEVAAATDNRPLPQVPPPNNADWTQTVQETPEGGYRMGNPDAPVKLVEYGSITCSHCAEFSEQGSQPLINTYVKSGQVSWEFRPYVLFPSDPGIFLLLRCQGPQPFFALTEQLYATQKDWVGRMQAQTPMINALPVEQKLAGFVQAGGIDQFFRQRGMPASRVQSCLADRASLQQVMNNSQRYTDQDGVTGTPTFFLNGEKLENVGYWNNGNVNQSLEPRLRAAIGS